MKKPWILCAVCLAAAILLMLTSLNLSTGGTSPAPAQKVALLTENENGTYYLQVKQGMLDAADTLGASLTIALIDDDRAAQAQSLKEDGVAAAVVLSERSDLRAATLSALKNAGIVAVSAGSAGGDCAVTQNPVDDAKQLADALKAAGCTRALVLPDDSGALSGAFLAMWGGTHFMLASAEDAASAQPGDGIVALAADGTRAAMELKKSGEIPADVPLFGVDTGSTRSEDLETGYIAGMLLEQPYTVGYLAFQVALEAEEGEKVDPVAYAASRIVTPDTMYLPENVKIVFPLLQ